MAELGPGPHLYMDVAALLADADALLEASREQLVQKGMIWEPTYNRVAFTTPLFDQFMKRRMPTGEWRPRNNTVDGPVLMAARKS